MATGALTITAAVHRELVRFGVPVTPPPETVIVSRSFTDPADNVLISKIVPAGLGLSSPLPPDSRHRRPPPRRVRTVAD